MDENLELQNDNGDDGLIFNIDEPEWELFIDQIIQRNVVPVIGPEILCDDGNFHYTIINCLAKNLGIKRNFNSFSELIYDHEYLSKYKKEYIYTYVNQLLAQKKFKPSTLLKDILSIRQFPFVITTSFTPIVENVMREIWGDELRVMKFKNDPPENQDIKDDIDFYKPTVYYMFGRYGDSAHRYVVTDNDMLDFCSSWIAETDGRPKNLVNHLKNKYLLMLGNNYSDWLFRFIWYSLRKSGVGNGLYAYETVEDELSRFLQRNQAFLQNPTKNTVDIMRDKLDNRLKQSLSTKFKHVEYGADIFISYSRKDSEIAEKLYTELTKKGKTVWYDKNNISAGNKFMSEIRKAIRTANYFIPILTDNIEKEKNDSHVYRIEWDEAIQAGTSYGRTYIIPVSQKNYNFYNANLPDKLDTIQQHHAIEFDSIDDIESVVEKIIDAISNVKN